MSTIQLKNSTVPGKVPLPGDLTAGELALNSADGKAYMKLDNGTVKELGGSGPTPPPITPWVRNPTWLPMPATTSAMEQVDMLVCVYPESNYFATQMQVSNGTTFTVDWGDGTAPQTSPSNTPINYLYDYNAAGLAGTNGPVTFDASTSTVNRTAHGYTNGMRISFAEIVTTVGIIQSQIYYVIGATADAFQLSATEGGSVITLTNNGTGAILPYKQAMVRVTPTTPGALATRVTLNVKNTTTGLQSYSQPILDMTISASCTSLVIGGGTVLFRLTERVTILKHNVTNFIGLFNTYSSLRSVVINDTSTITNMSSMFSGCNSLQEVPLFNTSNVTTMNSMFNGCLNIKSVPLFDTQNVTDMGTMFNLCNSLLSVPVFNTVKVTNMLGMFSGCSALLTIPLFNTSLVLDMSTMFSGCVSLQTVPLFDTIKVTNMTGMFNGCSSLQTVPLFNTSNVTAMNGANATFGMFSGCNSLVSVPLFDTSKITTTVSMFNGCSSLQTVPLFNTSNVTLMGGSSTTLGMFSGCSSLQIVPFFNTAKVTSFGSMFASCTNIGLIPLFDTTAVTGTTAFTQMFNGCSSLQQVPDMNFGRAAITTSASYTSMFSSCNSLSKINLSPGNGPKFTFSVGSAKLSAASLNQLYTSLPTVTGQTITVTGNVGINGDDPNIAILKGWSVVGS